MDTIVRHPAVAGRFYPADANILSRDLNFYLSSNKQDSLDRKNIPALGCVVPHAGYVYSGHVAGAAFAALDLPKHFLILGPNHTGLGEPLAIMRQGAWKTPLGEVEINSGLATALLERFPLLAEDAEAHRAEHAIEVQLPFLQTLRPDCTFVPITIGTSQLDVLIALGEAIAGVLSEQTEPVLIISSSDMNHYENDAITRVKDHRAIEQILLLNAQRLAETVNEQKISMCGIWPTVVMLTAVKKMGARAGQLVKYATSGDVFGERSHVVGYAGIVIR
ncbi:MAG TPA: AmmeMemoRadiSam system protein B [Terriglobales bacterium]|jgi:MEMO1 family protein|nr:AmmeMemoRadiSam system protein B [Terriglobales bacterium]